MSSSKKNDLNKKRTKDTLHSYKSLVTLVVGNTAQITKGLIMNQEEREKFITGFYDVINLTMERLEIANNGQALDYLIGFLATKGSMSRHSYEVIEEALCISLKKFHTAVTIANKPLEVSEVLQLVE